MSVFFFCIIEHIFPFSSVDMVLISIFLYLGGHVWLSLREWAIPPHSLVPPPASPFGSCRKYYGVSIYFMPDFVPWTKQIMGVVHVGLVLGNGLHSTLAARLLSTGREQRRVWLLPGEICSHSRSTLVNRTSMKDFSEMSLTLRTQWYLKRSWATFLHMQHNGPHSDKCLTRLCPEKVLEYSTTYDQRK